MPPFIVLLAISALILFFAMLAKRQTGKSRRPLRLQSKPVMTAREQQMYHLLQTALPECTVLVQVAFSALVTAQGRANRNRFDRKVADFVLCSQQLNVIAVSSSTTAATPAANARTRSATPYSGWPAM